MGEGKGVILEATLRTQDRISEVDRVQMKGAQEAIEVGALNTQDAEDGISRGVDDTSKAEDEDVNMMGEIREGSG